MPFGITSTIASSTPSSTPSLLGLGDADDAVESPDRLLLPVAAKHAIPGGREASIGPHGEVDLAPEAQRFHVVHRQHRLRPVAGIDGADVGTSVGELDLNDVVLAPRCQPLQPLRELDIAVEAQDQQPAVEPAFGQPARHPPRAR
jgi:hypothetical protein